MLSSRLHFPVQLTSKLVYKFLILLYFRRDLYFGICLGFVVLYTTNAVVSLADVVVSSPFPCSVNFETRL